MSTDFPSALDEFLSIADNPAMNASGRTATQVIEQLQSALAAVQAKLGVTDSEVAGTVEKRLVDGAPKGPQFAIQISDGEGALANSSIAASWSFDAGSISCPGVLSLLATNPGGGGFRYLDISHNGSEPIYGNGSVTWSVLHTGNVKTVGGVSIYGSGNIAVAAAIHSHTASQISDSTAAGRSMLTAADAAAQRGLLSVETTTQLNSRDTNNRARANHTGTQLAATISDFATAVAATAAVAANTAKVSNATHTGDVTGSTALTIADGVVTNTKLANMATATIKGRTTAGTGAAEDLSAAQVRALLNVQNGATANASDASLRDRSTHTGSQLASTISDFDSATRAQAEALLAAGAGITLTPSGSGGSRQVEVSLTSEVVMEFATAGSFTGNTRPDPALYPLCEALLIGGGGGGGSGRRGATTADCRGGGGGGGGGVTRVVLNTANFGSTFTVIVGAGGAGGFGITADDTDGLAGAAGGSTDVLNFTGSVAMSPSGRLRAVGGAAGGGGTTAAGAGGAGTVSHLQHIAQVDGAGGSSVAGAIGESATTTAVRPAGGGGGGSLAASLTTSYAGGASVLALHIQVSGGNGNSSGNALPGSNGTVSEEIDGSTACRGGGGGGSSSAGTGGSGGAGVRGSGGGGGGASRNGSNSGIGGAGGAGYIRLRFYR